MFAPTQEQVRRFFCEAWAKSQAGQPLQAIEQLAAGWVAEHPEWHAELADADAAVARDYGEGAVGGNPCTCRCTCRSASSAASTSRPASARRWSCWPPAGATCTAHHEVMDCLGQMLADAQARRGAPMARPTWTACAGAPRTLSQLFY
jgi:hypothetical protein